MRLLENSKVASCLTDGLIAYRLGPSEFCVIGSLKDWSITDILHKISYPTLLISSPDDSVQEISVLPFFLKIPKVKWIEFQNSTHLPASEEPERCVLTLIPRPIIPCQHGVMQILPGPFQFLDRDQSLGKEQHVSDLI